MTTTPGNTICYCFGYSEEDIRQDVRHNGGRSAILERIIAEKKRAACQCATLHPEVGDVFLTFTVLWTMKLGHKRNLS